VKIRGRVGKIPIPIIEALPTTEPPKYRVAQNKIPHQTICNISATSGLILKILEAA